MTGLNRLVKCHSINFTFGYETRSMPNSLTIMQVLRFGFLLLNSNLIVANKITMRLVEKNFSKTSLQNEL